LSFADRLKAKPAPAAVLPPQQQRPPPQQAAAVAPPRIQQQQQTRGTLMNAHAEKGDTAACERVTQDMWAAPLPGQGLPNRRVQSPKLNPTPPQQNIVSEALVLFISGATGVNAASINGVYDRTSETSGGYALYRKRGDGSVCMEHFGGKWQVKLVSSKGTASCYAYVAGGCAAEACTSRQWTIGDGQSWTDAPLVKMVAEAQRQVGCCRLHAPPPARGHCFL
jgi:hypothetical protein